MRFGFRETSLLVLAITAAACSRGMFAAFHDPEGPNLLVTGVMALVLFVISSVAYLSNRVPSLTGLGRCAIAILIQMLVAAGTYLGLR